MMSCTSNLLELNRNMYKSREALDIHRTKRHWKPSSLYDQMKIAQFALREMWFEDTTSLVRKYPWGNKVFKDDEAVSTRYLNAIAKGQTKVRSEFESFLHRKFPNEMAKFVDDEFADDDLLIMDERWDYGILKGYQGKSTVWRQFLSHFFPPWQNNTCH